MGTIATVTIGADTFSVYALTANAVADATSFWNGRLGAAATAWAGAVADDQARALVTASFWIDRAVGPFFSGEKTVAGQPREWPRDGATCDGESIPDGTTPDEVALATFWLAGNILVDNELSYGSGTGSNVKQARAGSASVTFFTPTINSSTDTRLPLPAMDYLACLFESLSAALAGFASGTGNASAFCDTDFTRSEGYP